MLSSNEIRPAGCEAGGPQASPKVSARSHPLQALNWLVPSYYRLRDRRLAARIESVRADRIKGAVFSFAKVRWVNGLPSIDSGDIQCVEEWDLRGDAQGHAEHDLMELIR